MPKANDVLADTVVHDTSDGRLMIRNMQAWHAQSCLIRLAKSINRHPFGHGTTENSLSPQFGRKTTSKAGQTNRS